MSKEASKRPVFVKLDAKQASKRTRSSDQPRAIFAAEDEDDSAEPVTLTCPLKTIQFVNHTIVGWQIKHSKIEELPKKLIREETGRAFRLQASICFAIF